MRLFLCLAAAAGVLSAEELSPAARAWWKHVQVLADDKMEGRNTGSPGHRMAAEYVAGEMERAGLKPGGSDGYFQPVPFRVRKIDESRSSVELLRNGVVEPLQLGRDVVIGLRNDPAEQVEAPVVFVGYGMQVPEKGHDDLAGIDLKGKVACYIQGVPAGIPSELAAHYQSAAERWGRLRAAGAIGTLVIQNPKSMDVPWARAARARLQPSMDLADPSFEESKGLQIGLSFNAERADRLFQGTPNTIAELLAMATEKKPLPRFPLGVSIRAKQAVERSDVLSQNVIGVLPGTDPKLRNEFVVISAHLDHVGKSTVIEGDGIHNGAMDNASGIASMLEIARWLKESKTKNKRSIAFVAVTGEEKGLRGSRFFAVNPTLKGKMVADVNMDMFLPLHELKQLQVLGLNESDLGETMRAAAEKQGIRVTGDPQPERNLFIRSDQYSFVREGVPSINAKFGYEPDSPEAKIQKDWLTERYHAPSDDLDQPVDKEAAVKYTRILMDFVERVASQPQAPRWKETSFFKRFEKR